SILGENVFEIHHTTNSGTSKCQKETRQVDDGLITVIDTPGMFDSRNSDDAFKSEIIDMIIESSEGLDAFLILFKAERFTGQENEVVSKIKDYFSEEAFKHAVVVFTHGDQLPDGMKIEEFVSENKYLCDLLEKCGNRCCVVDNKYWKNNQQDKYRNNQVQVAKLLQTVKEMGMSGGRYINEMLREMRRREVSDLLKKLAGLTAGVLLGALLGVPCMVAKVILELRKNKTVALHGLPAAAASGTTLPAVAASGVALSAATVSGFVDGLGSVNWLIVHQFIVSIC
uniref:AIG1-type G domain-containing protein n=1 Tax=Amphiprion ocellaris TaxID=80972 RepID=A0AAQ5Z974_AMPOC